MATVEANYEPELGRVGARFLGYVLSVSDTVAADIARATQEASAEQLSVLEELRGLLAATDAVGPEAAFDDLHALFLISQRFATGGVRANEWRRRTGGVFPRIGADGAPERCLIALALDAYPAFLFACERTRHVRHPPSSVVLVGHASTAFVTAVLADDELSRLFPDRDERQPAMSNGSLGSSVGSAGDMQAAVWGSALLTNAWMLSILRARGSLEAFIDAVKEVLVLSRLAATKHRAEVPVFVGFHEVALRSPGPHAFPQGNLRAVREDDRLLIPRRSQPSTLSLEDILLGCILETTWPVTYSISVGDLVIPPTEKTHEALREKIEQLGFALSLAVTRSPPVAWSWAWTWCPDPTSGIGQMSFRDRPRMPVGPHVLEDADVVELSAWASRVAIGAASDRRIRIARRRLQSALAERPDPIDGFIDAVIGLENLFGDKAELVFRISSALAILLGGSDLARRRDVQKRAKDLYEARSKVVHGSSELSSNEARTHRDDAVALLAEALRYLYRDRTDLLSDASRSTTLILGG